MKAHYLVLAACVALAHPAQAQEPESKVEVSGIKNPALRPYRQMQKGLEAFDRFRSLAPEASLRFELWTAENTMPDPAGLTLRVRGETVDIDVPIDDHASFILPYSRQAADENAELVLNRRKGQMHWSPQVRSPGLPAHVRRLGDLRLECEVAWAVEKEDLPLMARMAVAPFGGLCHTPMTGLYFRAPQRLVSATLVSGERRLALPLSGRGMVFMAPLRDRDWNDDSLVVYAFADEKKALDAP